MEFSYSGSESSSDSSDEEIGDHISYNEEWDVVNEVPGNVPGGEWFLPKGIKLSFNLQYRNRFSLFVYPNQKNILSCNG